MKTIKISYQKHDYDLSFEKITHILTILENKKCNNLKKEELVNLMKKYKLFDSAFLENINKI